MQLVVNGSQAEFISSDSKTSLLVNQYESLLGASREDFAEFVTVLYPAFMQQVRAKAKV